MAARTPGHRPGTGIERAGRWRRAGLLGAAVAVSAALAACSPQIRHHGYVPDDSLVSGIEVGRATRDDVAAAIGPPRATALVSDDAWFYVGSRWEQRAPRPAVEVSRDLLAITFDGRGVVSNIERFTLQDGQAVPLSRRVTQTSVREQGLFSRILSNVGRFSASDLVD
ncbi:outer membrane protein assembly factor BamE [Rhodobaculum claviforme]|uniref:Outer membrane protein assembly factor BamE domain-containing protein n=1 Tax=Rhodobaculum claviforme TaxID=1549854 RepID=A0A934TMP8_9RHOB|nr:outer membrane protein assembly factor BamE [Rhodobaculum claviforme]MBK5928374.1 hypothetical protein [Rhodobaculum claviforme]